ncbi:adenosylcobinamide-phosphate synthase CbiB [Polaromonas sp. OV174]|uniref:adenosylcobinamide-phosphate synthase CbiB n=1 Tax=Polaromonas sp. OV174 TaxID=1855300 RepID=UPI002101AD56|nr:adenosylcobinamide-phosphate synthase CbiB [Polaromonas sp. OV174]
MTIAAGLLVALAIDRLLGEPPARLHPVVWMGRYLGWAGKRIAPAESGSGPDWRAFGAGALAWCVGAALVMGLACWAQQAVAGWHPLLAGLVLGCLLKPLLAWRMLRNEVLAVEAALAQSLMTGRARLAWLVSRDVINLSEAQVRESAIESLAENLNDSVVAPLFWFVLLGLPGAALYRLANTADAMWGYPGMRGGRYWQWAGKWAARADDVLSWLPARITALLLALAARGLPLRALRQQARQTPSPNSGWPMAAMALALGVRLAKPGVYVLNEAGRAVQPGDMQRAVVLASKVLVSLVACALSAIVFVVFRVFS